LSTFLLVGNMIWYVSLINTNEEHYSMQKWLDLQWNLTFTYLFFKFQRTKTTFKNRFEDTKGVIRYDIHPLDLRK